jgi:hypothetical protein
MQHDVMVRILPSIQAGHSVRAVQISLPLIPPLVDGRKYALPQDLVAPTPPPRLDRAALRRQIYRQAREAVAKERHRRERQEEARILRLVRIAVE